MCSSCQRNRRFASFLRASFALGALSFALIAFSCQKKQVKKKVSQPVQIAPKKEKSLVVEHTVVVLADDKSEKVLGRFPWTRQYLIDILPKLKKAKLVVLGFSMDQKSGYRLDRQLETAVAQNRNVVLQAKLAAQGREESSKHLAYRDLPHVQEAHIKYNGRYAWLPYLTLADKAKGIGFVQFNHEFVKEDHFPLVVRFGNNIYPTMPLAVYKEYYGLPRQAIYAGNRFLYLGKKKMPLKALNGLANRFMKQKLPTYSFVDVLQDRVQPERFQDKVVIIGYHFARLRGIQTPYGKMAPSLLMARRIETMLQLTN